MSSSSEASSILLYSLNIGFFLFGILAEVVVRRLSKREKVHPIRWGIASIVALNVLLLGLVISHFSNIPAQVATDGVQQFNNSVSMGAMLGTVISPGLIMLCLIWIYIRVRAGQIVLRVESADDIDASRVVSIGNKVATVIFWIVGGGFLLLILGALVFGS
ncbi:hypothetical protein [Methylophaga sp. OBS4]|uniref:hypothetical protein n=1 Tax=Methylophaga sp. OBS4 TaxID=2991935 RepID=UPI00224E6FA9|nr:hypothetical protein [Methylophaga sp. OBS4]MCX4187615.1 hypothetical protein [Methylophaga sp. OBS4]